MITEIYRDQMGQAVRLEYLGEMMDLFWYDRRFTNGEEGSPSV